MSRLLSAAIAAVIAVVTLPLAAQQPVGVAANVVPKVLATKAKQSALTVIQGNTRSTRRTAS
jgi:hypothetical protein